MTGALTCNCGTGLLLVEATVSVVLHVICLLLLKEIMLVAIAGCAVDLLLLDEIRLLTIVRCVVGSLLLEITELVVFSGCVVG